MSIEHRKFTVHGRVQGVFYRQSTRQQAQQLGLTGYARNNPDGTVTIEAEGPAAVLAQLAQWCQQGPPSARVEQVEATAGPVRSYHAFEIRG
ncbi:acylphosphatase [Hymenobacter amundsenii]|uniref:acylphosphatase n=1 Tax=Hymenobacter amundsenii TaxID=2006685 RepID=A0A246FGT7_9BACT|nr:acylphosphatase [Hymenobacter amundsenii]OWP61724.1 acylphosphatase [Hymenobacter amundsenii]